MTSISALLVCLAAFLLGVQGQRYPCVARHGLSAYDYQQLFNNLTSQNYRLNWVSGYALNNGPHFAAVFEKRPSPTWYAHHGLTSQQYQEAFNKYTSQGANLVLVNGYSVGGVDYYTAIWDKSATGAWLSRHAMTSSEYQTAFNNNAGAGYRLVHVSGYSIGSDARYAAIWRKTNDGIPWVARHAMTAGDYQSWFNTYVSQGYRLIQVNGYEIAGTDYYAAIWDKSSSGSWVAKSGMTSDQYQAEFNYYTSQGFILKTISGYNNAGHYAAIWQK